MADATRPTRARLAIENSLLYLEAQQEILVVDDEPQILIALEDLLSDQFTVYKATSAESALSMMEQRHDIAVVVTDQRMPQMPGDEHRREVFAVGRAAVGDDGDRFDARHVEAVEGAQQVVLPLGDPLADLGVERDRGLLVGADPGAGDVRHGR